MANPSPPGVPLPGRFPSPLPSRKYAQRFWTLSSSSNCCTRGGTSSPLLSAPHTGSAAEPGTSGKEAVRSRGGSISASAGIGLSKPTCPHSVPKNLSPKAGPGLAFPSPTHILNYPEEGRASRDRSAKSSFCPGPHYMYPFSLPPSSVRGQTRPRLLTSRLIPNAFPTKLLTLPILSPTNSADNLPSGSLPPPGPLLQVQVTRRGKFQVTRVSRSLLVPFGIRRKWRPVQLLARPSDPRGVSSHLQRGRERP